MCEKTKIIEMLQGLINLDKKMLKIIIKPIVKKYRKYLSIKKILDVLKIKQNTYYSWLKNEPKRIKRENKQELITQRVGLLCKKHYFVFGYRKITFLYRKVFNEIVNHKVILKIMKNNNWLAKWPIPNSKNKFYEKISKKWPNLINNDFKAEKPLKKLYTDLTCVLNQNGNLWFSCVIDGFNNQILAFETSIHPDLELVKNTFKQIPNIKDSCIIHSDQGIVYQSKKLQNYLKDKNFVVSMSRKSTPNDNAVIESCFNNLKNWLKKQYNDIFFDNHHQIKIKINKFINFWNKKWIFKKFNYQTPIEYRNSLIK